MRSTIARRSAAFSLVVGAAAVAWYLAAGWRAWATPSHLVVTGALGLVVAAGVVTLWRGSPHRRTVGGIVLLTGFVLVLLGVPRVLVMSTHVNPTAHLAFLAGITLLSGVGVLLRVRSARWLALGGAAAGALSSGLNLVRWWMLAGIVDEAGWTLSVWTLGSAVVFAVLCGPAVAAGDRVRQARDEVWTRRDPIVRWMRASIVTGVAASMMLLVYAKVQLGAVDALTTPAIALAALLAVAGVLAAGGQVVGGVLMAIGALALTALSVAVVVMAPADSGSLQIAGYYLVFWVPACAAGLACGAALLWRMLRAA